jgi:hypothetical protein
MGNESKAGSRKPNTRELRLAVQSLLRQSRHAALVSSAAAAESSRLCDFHVVDHCGELTAREAAGAIVWPQEAALGSKPGTGERRAKRPPASGCCKRWSAVRPAQAVVTNNVRKSLPPNTSLVTWAQGNGISPTLRPSGHSARCANR